MLQSIAYSVLSSNNTGKKAEFDGVNVHLEPMIKISFTKRYFHYSSQDRLSVQRPPGEKREMKATQLMQHV